MSQILIKRKMANGDKQVLLGELISQEGETMRVTMPTIRGVFEVNASETLPVQKVFGNPTVDVRRSSRTAIKMYSGPSSLHGMLSK